MSGFALLPGRRGRIEYRHRSGGELWGLEEFRITRGLDGLRVMSAHCEMRLGEDWVVRDSIQSVHPDYHPRDAHVRIMRDGALTGTGWFSFTDDEAICESDTKDGGRISQRFPIQRPIRGFGMHALQSDAWLAAPFPFEKGAGHVHFFGTNLMHSIHHLGATGPFIATTGSGLEYLGPETVDVPAGRFDCHRVRFVGLTNGHPEYHLWVTRDGDFLYVKGDVEGYMDSVFELTEISGNPL